ncbi:potassium-transporting ATPase subunit C [Dongshaea marina]|uniref:potassium-transporting ATPase subunit C n=1 Tax=Dongshaea marina TaxID=2047966 RepID=UPI000D3E3AD0|nr:potassium-transporting ATPase subunit C [Dongshaea marina]
MIKSIKESLLLLVMMSVLTGVFYPGVVMAIAQLVWPAQANGSLILDGSGQARGSYLLGQDYSGKGYFHLRPLTGQDNGGRGNLAVSSEARRQFEAAHAKPGMPAVLATVSASGVDPDLPFDAAVYQIPRVARARHMSQFELESVIQKQAQGGMLGPRYVNVMRLNQELDKISGIH